MRTLGADVRRGDLDDLDGLRAAVSEADGVIHLAFKHEEMQSGDLAGAIAADLRAIETMGTALTGSDKPLVATGATLALVLAGFQGQLTEHDTLPGGPRIDAENSVIALAQQGVRSSFVRLPPTVHSDPTSSQITSETLGWTPTRPGLIADLDEDHYFAVEADTASAG